MYLKKRYHKDRLVRDKDGAIVGVKDRDGKTVDRMITVEEDGKKVVKENPAFSKISSTAVEDVDVIRAKKDQRISPSLLEKGGMEGWLSMSNGVVKIGKGKSAVSYTIVETPGLFCCFDNARMDDEVTARAYIEKNFKGKKSPDPQNPSGYRQDNFYTLKKVEKPAEKVAGAAAAILALIGGWLLGGLEYLADAAVPVGLVGANLVFNISLGRFIEFYVRVDTNDPAASELVVAVLATSGVEADSVLRDKDTFSDLVSGATNFVTNSGYAQKVLADADIVAFSPDDTNDRADVDIPDQTWTAVAAGDGWNDIVIGYDPVGSQTATDIVPMTIHDFVVTPDGSDITAQIAAAGFGRASPV